MIEKIFSYTESGRVQLNAYIKSDVFRAREVLLITSQKDLEAFTTGKRNPNDVRGGAHILGSNFTIP